MAEGRKYSLGFYNTVMKARSKVCQSNTNIKREKSLCQFTANIRMKTNKNIFQ